MNKKIRKIILPLSTVVFLTNFYSNENHINASEKYDEYIGNESNYLDLIIRNEFDNYDNFDSFDSVVRDIVYEKLGFFTDEEKSIAEKFFTTEKTTEGNLYTLSFTDIGKDLIGAIGNDPYSWSNFIKENNITNQNQLTNKIKEANSIRNEINSLLGSTTVNGSKNDVKVELINGVYQLTSTSTGKNILSSSDQKKLQTLISEYEKKTGIKFNSDTMLNVLNFNSNMMFDGIIGDVYAGGLTLEYQPKYKHFNYTEKVIFTVKRIDGSGSVSTVLPLSQQLNTKHNSSMSTKFKNLTGQSFPSATIKGNTVTYDFSTPILSSGGNIHDKIRETWTGTTNYNPALALKVNNNGLYEVTAKVYGGTYTETSEKYILELEATSNPNHPYNGKTLEQVIGKKPERKNYSTNKKYQTALNNWNKKKKEYNDKMAKYKAYKEDYKDTDITFLLKDKKELDNYVKNYLKKDVNNYRFNIYLPNPLGTTNGNKYLYKQSLETEYWPYKERYVYKDKTYNQLEYKFMENIVGKEQKSKLVGKNKMPTYESKLINKAPDNVTTNKLIGTYTWKIGVTNKEIIIPTTAQNAEIGSTLTK